jgi:hypothetical protein
MGIFGGSSKIELALSQTSFLPGAEFTCRVDLRQIDGKARRAFVEFGYRNTYEYEGEIETSDHTSYDISTRETTRMRTTDWVGKQTVELCSGSPVPGTYDAAFLVPESGPPSVAKTVEWKVRAVIERDRGSDTKVESGVVVGTRPGMLESRTQSPPASSTIVPMTLEVATREVYRGNVLAGHLTAWPTVPIQTKGLRVQLVGEREEQDEIDHRKVHSPVPVTGPFLLHPGDPLSVPFQILIPATIEPSFQAWHNEQHWYLEAVVDISRGSDETARIELVVM